MCNGKWNPLPDIEQVANAKILGWEIEVCVGNNCWHPWNKQSWNEQASYRGRPKQPRTVTMTSECWRWGDGALVWREPNNIPAGDRWKRFPAGDITGEVEE